MRKCLSYRLLIPAIAIELHTLFATHLPADDWTQFRGSNGTAVASAKEKLPNDIGPTKNVLWRTDLPSGHSSPVIIGDHIFVTAVRQKTLLTIDLDRVTGDVQWEQKAPYEKLESIHRSGSYAQSSPCADGQHVVSFFGSCGLHCYDHSGTLLWKKSMGPFVNDFGVSSSPILVGNRIIVCLDHDAGSALMSLDLETGGVQWKTNRSTFSRNASTPILWQNQGRMQLVVAGTLRVVGYDLETGHEEWTVRGISRSVSCSPTVGDDGNLYIAGWAAGGDENEPIRIPSFEDVLEHRDSNANGTLEEDELESGAVLQRYTQIDLNKDGHLTAAEYNYFRGLLDEGRNLVISIGQGAKGDSTETHLRWKHPKLVPFCASPVWVNGLLFTIKDGGILQCLDSHSGKPTKQLRLDANDSYFASPVVGDGKIFLFDEQGRSSVVSAIHKFGVLSTSEFHEDVYATPAIVGGRIYVRTSKALYCFGLSPN